MVAGSSGTQTGSTSFTVSVTAEAEFQLSAQPPSVSVTPGSTVNVLITITDNSGPIPNLVFNTPTDGQLGNTGLAVNLNPTAPQPNERIISVQASPIAQPTSNFPLVITAQNENNLNDSNALTIPIAVTNSAPTTSAPTRSTIIRTDMDPTGAVYDQTRKLVFVTVRQLNEVQVYSTVDGSLRAQLSVNQPQGIDESADGNTVYVGGLGSTIAVIDPNLLQVTKTFPGPLTPGTGFAGLTVSPALLATLSNGKVLVVASNTGTAGSLFLFDPTSGVYSSETIPNGLLIINRSADHSKVLLGSQDEPTSLGLYDAATDTLVFSGNIVTAGSAPSIAALSPDGSQIVFPSGQNLILFDNSFNQLESVSLNEGDVLPPQLLYSLDGKFIYARSTANGVSAVAVLDSKTLNVLGVAPSNLFLFYAVDETGMLFGDAAVTRALGFTDASSPSDIRLPTPVLSIPAGGTLLNPSASTPLSLTGLDFSNNDQYQMFLGPAPGSPDARPPVALSQVTSTAVQATAPPSNTLGAVNITLTRTDGWNEIAPDGASYGPQILRLTQNAGPATGGTPIVVYGYGLLSSGTSLTIGGNAAPITEVFGSGFISPFPFPMDEIIATTPSGAPGLADVKVTTPLGSTTLTGGFQYLAQAQVFPVAGELNQIIYDQGRQRLYASNTDHNQVQVFSLSSATYLTPIPAGHNPGGVALTPDGSKLAVLNSGDGTVSVVNPDTQATVATYSVLTQTDIASGCQGVPVAITPAGSHGLFVAVDCTALFANGTLHFLDLNTGSLSCSALPLCNTAGTNIVLPSSSGLFVLASSQDGSKVLIGDAGAEPAAVALFDMNANTAIRTTFLNLVGDAAVDVDRNRFITNFAIYDPNLLEIGLPQDIDYLDAGEESIAATPGEKFSPSGSLLFVPRAAVSGVTVGGLDVYDVYRGRLVLRAALPDPIPGSLNCMALDETGSRIFLITNKGISVLQLSQVPLSIASVNNSTASAGDQVTIRGSGFKAGATVTFGTAIVSATVVDGNTIHATVPSLPPGPVRISVKNVDGNQYSIDAVFSVQ
jgi:DNA-binding beta-propeller fold protein YncE